MHYMKYLCEFVPLSTFLKYLVEVGQNVISTSQLLCTHTRNLTLQNKHDGTQGNREQYVKHTNKLWGPRLRVGMGLKSEQGHFIFIVSGLAVAGTEPPT